MIPHSGRNGARILLSVLAVILFAIPSHGFVVTGSVSDSTTNAAVVGARLSFRLSTTPEDNPTATTDSAGAFRAELALEPGFHLEMLIEAAGHEVKKVECDVEGDSVNLGRIALVPLRPVTIAFLGMVRDSVGTFPLVGVPIQLQRSWGPGGAFATLITDASGRFKEQVELPGSPSERVSWSISFSGYYSAGGTLDVERDGKPLVILLRPIGSIRIPVEGTLIDAVSRQSIDNATVVMWTNYLYAEPDTSRTIAYGRIMTSVQTGTTSSAIPEFNYFINANGYAVFSGKLRLDSYSVSLDLGTIELSRIGAGLQRLDGSRRRVAPTTGRQKVFTADGRRLSEGDPDPAGNVELRFRTEPEDGKEILDAQEVLRAGRAKDLLPNED